jgi:hypothetical protein
MDVVIYARPQHRDNILAEGYGYADSAAAAAKGADVLSVHLGLGKQDPETKAFSNAGFVGREILSALNDRAVLLNYDRGELVDVSALGEALTSGKVRHAAVDADVFKTADGVMGPMKPYLSLLSEHADKLELLPHAAADTDHPTRVAGAKQAVDQIVDAIRNRAVTNPKGDLPEGYRSNGARIPLGVGQVTSKDLARLANSDLLGDLRQTVETIASVIGALDAVTDPTHRARIIERYRSVLTANVMRQNHLIAAAGLAAPAAAK